MRQIVNTVAGDVTVPKAAIEATYRYDNEERAIDYVVLDRSQAGDVTAPSPEDLAKYYEERKAQFRAPEYRKVVLVVVTPVELAKWETINDTDARRIFEERKARYSTPELRKVHQIVSHLESSTGVTTTNTTLRYSGARNCALRSS